MDVIRFGLGMRALRRKRGWTQDELGARARVSRAAIWRIERGQADRVAVHVLVRVAAALGARIDVRLLWQGEGLDRLLDAGHADLVERIIELLTASDWLTATEVSFNVRGERGSIDILAFHPPTGTLLVIEVKSVVPDMQAMLSGIDRKGRLAREIARSRGWNVTTVTRLLILPDDRTARRRSNDTRPPSGPRSRRGPSRCDGGSGILGERWTASCSCQALTTRALVTGSRRDEEIRADSQACRVSLGRDDSDGCSGDDVSVSRFLTSARVTSIWQRRMAGPIP